MLEKAGVQQPEYKSPSLSLLLHSVLLVPRLIHESHSHLPFILPPSFHFLNPVLIFYFSSNHKTIRKFEMHFHCFTIFTLVLLCFNFASGKPQVRISRN
jgi:hypothetical protein